MLHFIAIVTPDSINQQVLVWKEFMLQQFNCKAALKSPAHITLIPPFHLNDHEPLRMQQLLKPFAAYRQRFSIQLKNFAAFKPKVIYVDVLPNSSLNALQTSLETTLLQSGRFPIKKEERPYHPHVTIANRDLTAADFPEAWRHFQAMSYEATFTANAIVLLRHNGQVWDLAASFPFIN
jgi:2'-5' RNA ligase